MPASVPIASPVTAGVALRPAGRVTGLFSSRVIGVIAVMRAGGEQGRITHWRWIANAGPRVRTRLSSVSTYGMSALADRRGGAPANRHLCSRQLSPIEPRTQCRCVLGRSPETQQTPRSRATLSLEPSIGRGHGRVLELALSQRNGSG